MVEEKFREIFDKSPIGIIFFDKDGNLTDANKSTLEIMGYPSLNDVIGLNIFNDPYIAPKKDELLEKGHIKIQSPLDFDNIKEAGIYNPTKSGFAFLDLNISVIDSGFLGQIQDITERKKAEKRLKVSDDRYRGVVENTTAVIFRVNPEGIIQFANERALEFFGYSAEELIGKHALGTIVPEHDTAGRDLAAMINKIAKNPDCFHSNANENIRKNGECVWMEWTNSGIYDKNGNLKEFLSVGIDATEHKKAEEKTERILETIAESYVEYDNEWRYVDANIKFEETFGLKKDEIIGKVVWELFPQIVGTLQYKELHKAKNENIPLRFEAKSVISEDWFEVNAFPHPDGLTVYLHNINERKKAEEALKESENLYRTLFENTDDAFQIVELSYDKNDNVSDFRYLKTNQAFELQSGLKSSDIIGKMVRQVLPNIEPHWFEMYDKAAKEGKPVHDINYNQDTNRWYDMFYFPYSKEKVGVLFRDITERKKTEEELERLFNESEIDRNRLNTLIKTIPSGVIIIEQPDGEISFINERAKELYGMDPTGLEMEEYPQIGLLKLDGTPYPPEEMPASRSLLQGEVVRNEDLILENPDGKQVIVSASSAPIYNPKGEISAVIGVFDDISKRKKAEEQLKQLIEELERSNEDLQQFAYISSHDLQEPLRTIASFTQLLQRRYKGKLDSDADEFMDFIVEAAVRMKAQIQGLLEYSRVGTEGKEFQIVNMNEILNHTIQSLITTIEEAKANITVDELPNIRGDAVQLQRAFQNLISNAIRFRKCEEPLKVHISANKDIYGNEYVFSVSDNGIGIEEQYSERIFTIFQRLHTIDVYKGTGIGLSIVKRIIERHGGRIWVESEFDVGSTFYFTIPVKNE